MEKSERGKATKLLHQILDNIAYKEKSDDVTLFQLYPLINNPMTQTITKVFNIRLFGILIDLGILFQYAGTILRCKNVDQWGKILSSRPYTAIITRIRIQSVISTKVELSLPPENSNELKSTNVLTSDDHAYLKRLRAKFHNRIQKLDENDTPSDLSDDEEKNNRYQSVSFTEKYSDK